jgi:serine/threonine-protein kinase
MAPEQLSGAGVDARTDIYASGVVLWEALTGQRLFDGDNDGSILAQVFAGASRRPSEFVPTIPKALDDIVMAALASDPADRIATAREMAQALEDTTDLPKTHEIGDWVARIAAPTLAKRADAVARIEAGEAPSGTRERTWKAPAEQEGAGDPGVANVANLGTEAVTPSAPAQRSRDKRPIAFMGIAIAALLVTVGALLAQKHPPANAEQAAPAPSAPRTAEPAPSASTTSPVAASAAPEPTAANTAPSAASAKARGASKPPPAPVGRSKPPDCNPPFTVDEQNKMHWKPGCRD